MLLRHLLRPFRSRPKPLPPEADPVERICAKGCAAVRADIQAMEEGKVPQELLGLDAEQQGKALDELKQIMAVYQKKS